MRMLLDAGADFSLTTDDGTTPLMVAAGLGRYTNDKNLRRGERKPSAEGAVLMLLDAGADVHARNEADFTALHGAALRGLNEVVQTLLDHGADIDARDFRGRTPYRLAQGSKPGILFSRVSGYGRFSRGPGRRYQASVWRERCRSVFAMFLSRRPRPTATAGLSTCRGFLLSSVWSASCLPGERAPGGWPDAALDPRPCR